LDLEAPSKPGPTALLPKDGEEALRLPEDTEEYLSSSDLAADITASNLSEVIQNDVFPMREDTTTTTVNRATREHTFV
jgi:hypothetical protein